MAWLAHHEQNTAWLARQTKADPGTIGDFLNGNRWPKYGTQGRIEKALGWPAGTLTAIADGGQVPNLDGTSVGALGEAADSSADALLYRRPDGLTDGEWERVKQESREYIEWQIDRASKER